MKLRAAWSVPAPFAICRLSPYEVICIWDTSSILKTLGFFGAESFRFLVLLEAELSRELKLTRLNHVSTRF